MGEVQKGHKVHIYIKPDGTMDISEVCPEMQTILEAKGLRIVKPEVDEL